MYLKRLREIREDRDLKQRQIAELLNITQEQYYLYECGKRTIPIDLLVKLCKFYRISADYILELK